MDGRQDAGGVVVAVSVGVATLVGIDVTALLQRSKSELSGLGSVSLLGQLKHESPPRTGPRRQLAPGARVGTAVGVAGGIHCGALVDVSTVPPAAIQSEQLLGAPNPCKPLQ